MMSTAALVAFAVLFAASVLPVGAQVSTSGPVGVLPIKPVDSTYDHLRCYKIRDPHRFGALADLYPLQNPPFSIEPACRVKLTAREFCIPVHKQLRPLASKLSDQTPAVELAGQDLVNDFLCYKLKCPRTKLPNGWPVADQFGRRVVRRFKPIRLCTPTRKLPVQEKCCDPQEKPGTNGIAVCIEGATCCNDGIWRCNDAESNSSCPIDEGRECARCCDPAEEPGVDGNPLCFEGHTCCASGRWQCNEADGSSSCAVDGVVCDGCCKLSEEPGSNGNPICIEGHTCCSTGRWQCNDAGANSTCDLNGQACGCCDPRKEPGQFGNPICIEGHSCCANGTWQCNDAGGQSTCSFQGELCPDTCGGFSGVPCDNGEYCVLEAGQCCCDFQGTCAPIPEACPDNVDPVCGCDSVTYGNECEAAAAGVNIDHRGSCETCGGIAGVPCPAGQFCMLGEGQCCCDFQGTCVDPPQLCPLVLDPVCGCDGNTYDNECEAKRQGVNVDHTGPCDSAGATP